MGDLLKLILPFLSTTKNYEDVLKKLASFAFYEVYLITFLLRDIPSVSAAFQKAETYGTLGKAIALIPHYNLINVTGFAIALATAILSFVIKLHDRISDVFGIRLRFDVNHILFPLAKLTDSDVDESKREAIINNRDALMRSVFYRYASSRSDTPVVDKHDIEHALTAWSWFWVLAEAAFFTTAATIVTMILGASGLATTFMILTIVLLVLAGAQYFRLPRYVKPQIAAIAADPNSAKSVRAEFNAL